MFSLLYCLLFSILSLSSGASASMFVPSLTSRCIVSIALWCAVVLKMVDFPFILHVLNDATT